MNIFKFWIHLENQPPDSIAELCLNISDKMADENKSGLINEINLLSTQLNIHKQSVNFKNLSTFLSKARGGEWYLEKSGSRKILAGSQNLGNVFDKSRSLVFFMVCFLLF